MQQMGKTALMLLVVTGSFAWKTSAAATARPVELTVWMCQELVVMDLYVMWIPQNHVFTVQKKESIAPVVSNIYAVLIIIAMVSTKKFRFDDNTVRSLFLIS